MTNIKNMYLDVAYNTDSEDILEYNLNKNADRKKLERYLENKLDKVLNDAEIIKDNNEYIKELLKNDISQLEFKINKVVDKVKGAILVERKTTSTIYSTIIPITEQQTNKEKTTAIIKDGVIFGISDTKIEKEDVNILSINNITFKNLDIKKINKTKLEDFTISNLSHNTLPFEFTVNLSSLLSTTSALIISLKNYALIEVYKDNILEREKELSNYFIIPVDKDNNSITIRSYPTLHKSSDLDINFLGLSEMIYQEESIYESKEISIGDSFSNLVLDTCDNASDSNIDIKYYMSVNNKDYERINTIKSFKNKDNRIQSIIGLSKDSELDLLQINGIKRSEGDIQFILPDETQNYLNEEVTVYLKNKNKIRKNTLWLLIKEDTILFKSYLTTNAQIVVDNKEITKDEILLPKGLIKISLTDNYNYNYLEQVIGEENIFSSMLVKPILKKNDYKYISLTSIDLIEAFNTTNIKEIFIKNLKKEVFVSSLKLKAELNSVDKKTVPYISRILLRGI